MVRQLGELERLDADERQAALDQLGERARDRPRAARLDSEKEPTLPATLPVSPGPAPIEGSL
jgi:hypothetical protein